MLHDLVLNVALLLALATLYGVFVRVRQESERQARILAGLLFGAVAMAAMMVPFQQSPGLIYDGRSIVLCMAGLFGGGIAASIAALIAGIYRLNLGGVGAATGAATILCSAALGVVFRNRYGARPERIPPFQLFVFGVVVHLVMLSCQFLLPWPLPLQSLSQIALPVLTIFPLGTLLMAMLLGDQERRVAAEAALRSSEERYRSFVEASAQMVWTAGPEGSVEQDLPEWQAFTGQSAEQTRGFGWTDAIHPEDRPRVMQAWRDAPDARGLYEVEYRMKTHRGVWRRILSRGVPLRSPNGHIREWIGTCIDITDQRALEGQFRQAQKMEAVGRLAGGVAHDYNNMLNIILIYAELVLRKLRPEDPLRKDVEEIQTAAKRSAALTKQLLGFARKQVVRPQTLDLNRVIAETSKMLARLMGEDVAFSFSPGEALWPVLMDPTQLDQVLANLAVNARDAIEGVGEVTVETANITLDEAYRVGHTYASIGDYARISFTDSGRGMDRETMAKIFEPFFSTKGEAGTGLGLATVYGIIKQGGGFISVYSEPGQGTAFKIYLPRLLEEHSLRVEAHAVKPRGGSETILVVEDEEVILSLAQRILEEYGYEVLIAQSPGDALILVERRSEPIHLLLTDVVMPVMNGRELALRLEGLRPGIKTLFMSGFTANVIAHRGVLDEGVHFLQKPFSVEGLAAKVRSVLDA